MRPWIVMSVVLSFALACTFDSTGLDSTTAVAGPGSNPGSSGAATTGSGEVDTTQADASTEATSAGTSDSGSGTASASEATSQGPLCGNGVIDPGEACDGAELGGASCMSLGHAEGALLCGAMCQYDEQQCSSPGCGDGTPDPGEACDCGEGECTAPQLNNTSCSSLPAPMGGNFSGGELSCASPGPCTFDTSKCTYCGDGIKNAAELCDGPDLGGQSCASNGFFGGTLTCGPGCAPDTAGCTNCGNQMIDANEACDGNNFNGKTCQSIDDGKFAGGDLACGGNCGGISTDNCNSGNCCQTSNMPGTCSVKAIRDCVCLLNAGCCNISWGGACVFTAKNICGAEC